MELQCGIWASPSITTNTSHSLLTRRMNDSTTIFVISKFVNPFEDQKIQKYRLTKHVEKCIAYH